MKLTIGEVAQAVGVETVFDDRQISSVEFDSRKITPGGLFVPLQGVRDGHEFISAAVENGAVATFWSRDLAAVPAEIVAIPVEDPLEAMQKLAMYYKKKIAPKTIAITGSNGKTTTKDLTAAVLAEKYVTYKTQGNYNNNIGMPYTMLHMPENCQMLVLEMGMDHQGELAQLSKIAQPDVAAITMIGEAHIENLGSREKIAAAKMEIVTGLAEDGRLFIPAKEPLLPPLTTRLKNVTTFGINQGDTVGKIGAETKESTEFSVSGEDFEIPIIGAYNVENALIAYGIGENFGLTPQEIAQGFRKVALTKNRTQWLTAKNGAQILSDVYNANPSAMALVLETFGKLPTAGRKLAVLGDMLELGAESKEMHAQMAEHIGGNYQVIFLYGSEMKALWEALAKENSALTVYHFDKEAKAALLQMIQKELQPTDSIFLKASNGMGLAEIVTHLVEG